MSLGDGDGGRVELIGACGLEDAEPLLRRLLADPSLVVDLRRCDHAHTGLIQVLLASAAKTLGPARGRFLHEMVEPLLQRG
jgi:hypothetical protein